MIDSLILRTAARFLLPLLLLFSVFLLISGHNEPGGGFVGGLVSAGAVILYAIAYDVATARRVMRVEPQTLFASGLGLALVSGLLPVIHQEPFLTGQWTVAVLGELGEVHIGTPLLFDVGVYLAVMGTALIMVLSLLEESEPETPRS